MTAKPLSEYHFNAYKAQPFQLRRECKACRKRIVWERYHGMKWSEYQRMLEAQHDKCAICRITLNEYRERYERYGEFHLDHDHQTKVVRGLLCHNCNRAIGMFQDNPGLLRAAADYIELKR